MQPIVLGPYSPADAEEKAFADTSWSGAGPFFPETTTTPDGLAHQVTLTVATDDYSGIDFTLVGIDADGNLISEVLSGPNDDTVTSTLFYSQLTEVLVSASLDMNAISAGIANASLLKTIPLDARSVAPALITATTGGTISYQVSQTADDVFNAPAALECNWFGLKNTASNDSQLFTSTVGARGIQVSILSSTSPATIVISLSQASSALG